MTLFSACLRWVGAGIAGLAALGLCSGARPAIAQIVTDGSLTVALSGLGNTNGQVCVSLFDSSGGFPDDSEAVVTERCVPADGSAEETTAELEQADLVMVFPNLVSGTYAVSVLHDENSDQQLNQGAFGIPTEGFGFSRNPTIGTSVPEFSEVAIFVLGDTTAQIEMVYF